MLNLALQSNSLAHYAKGTRSPHGLNHRAPTACRRLVSGSISLPVLGFFSPFPHGTGPLSVAREYLALEDGPPRFPRDSPCPAVLGYLRRRSSVSHTGLSPSMARLSSLFCYLLADRHTEAPRPRPACTDRFRLFPFRSPLLRESRLISFPPGT